MGRQLIDRGGQRCVGMQAAQLRPRFCRAEARGAQRQGEADKLTIIGRDDRDIPLLPCPVPPVSYTHLTLPTIYSV